MKQTISTIRRLIFCSLLALAALRAEGKIIYVNAAATGVNNGAAWPDAFTTVYAALDAARYGDQIWVARGTYYPTAGADRKVSLTLKNGVQLLGGFAGTETAAAQRNWRRNATILSGDIGARNDSLDNTFRVLRGSGLDSTTVLDGFVVERGNANDDNGLRAGSALLLQAEADGIVTVPVILNCIFRRNYANSGIILYGQTDNKGVCVPNLIQCRFTNNNGGVFIDSG